MAKPELPVIFRAERSGQFKGNVTAVFPTMAWDRAETLFTTYAHVGQHGGGTFAWYNSTRPASPKEYASLLKELTEIYDDCKLVVRKRFPTRKSK